MVATARPRALSTSLWRAQPAPHEGQSSGDPANPSGQNQRPSWPTPTFASGGVDLPRPFTIAAGTQQSAEAHASPVDQPPCLAPDPTKIIDLAYVDLTSEEHCCSICCDVLINPCVLRACKHTFCQMCIRKALSMHPSCPLCRAPATARDLLPPSPELLNVLDSLLCKCIESRCPWAGTRRQFVSHLRNECEFWPVACASHPLHEGCPEVVPRNELAAHRAHCSHRQIPCRMGCRGTFYNSSSMESHCRESCPLRSIDCPNCSMPLLAHQLTAHRSTCALERIPCPNRNLLSSVPSSGCNAIIERRNLELHLCECPAAPLRGFSKALERYLEGLERKIETMQVDHRKDLEKMSRLVLSGQGEDAISADQLQGMVRFNPAIKSIHAIYYEPGPNWQGLLEGLLASNHTNMASVDGSDSAGANRLDRRVHAFMHQIEFTPPAGSLLRSLMSTTGHQPASATPAGSAGRPHTAVRSPDRSSAHRHGGTRFGSLESYHSDHLDVGPDQPSLPSPDTKRLSPMFPHISTLDLEGSCIESSGAVLLAKFLKDPFCTITVLRLPGNDIRDQGMEHMARALEVNVTLERLDLSRNGVSERGIDVLLRSLVYGVPKLTELRLAGSGLKSKNVKTLVRTLTRRWSANGSPACQAQLALGRPSPQAAEPSNRASPGSGVQRLPNPPGSPMPTTANRGPHLHGTGTVRTHSSSLSDDVPLSMYQHPPHTADMRGSIPIPASGDVPLPSHLPMALPGSAPIERSINDHPPMFSLPGGGRYQLPSVDLEATRPHTSYSPPPQRQQQQPSRSAPNRGKRRLTQPARNASLLILDLSHNEITSKGLGELAKLLRYPQCRLQELRLDNNRIRGSLHCKATVPQPSKDAVGSGLLPRQPSVDEENTTAIRAFLAAIRACASPSSQQSPTALRCIDIRNNFIDCHAVSALQDAVEDLNRALSKPSDALYGSRSESKPMSLIRPTVKILCDGNVSMTLPRPPLPYDSRISQFESCRQSADPPRQVGSDRIFGNVAQSSLGYINAESDESEDEYVDARLGFSMEALPHAAMHGHGEQPETMPSLPPIEVPNLADLDSQYRDPLSSPPPLPSPPSVDIATQASASSDQPAVSFAETSESEAAPTRTKSRRRSFRGLGFGLSVSAAMPGSRRSSNASSSGGSSSSSASGSRHSSWSSGNGSSIAAKLVRRLSITRTE